MAVTSSSGRGRCARVDVCAQGVGEEDAWSRVECCMRGGGGGEKAELRKWTKIAFLY